MKINKDHLLYNFNGQGKPDPEIVHTQSIRSRSFSLKPMTFIVAFIVVVVLVAVVSIRTLVKERQEPVSENTEITDVSSTASSTAQEENISSLNTSFLFGFSLNSNDNLKLLAVASINTEDNSLHFKYIPVDTIASVDGTTVTLQSHFSQGGITRIQHALISRFETACARYIFSSGQTLTDIFKVIGEIEITIDKNIEYTYDGIDIILEKGTSNFNQDMLIKYFSYLCDNISSCESEMAEFLKVVASRLFDENDNEYFMNMYSKIINNLTTDISLKDIQETLLILNNFYKAGAVENVYIERIY